MDNQIFSFLYGFAHRAPLLDNLIGFFSFWFPFVVVILAGIFILFHHEIFSTEYPWKALKQKWKEIVLAFFSGISAWVLAQILKVIFHTSRPILSLGNVVPLLNKDSHAFPSGHATFFMALAFAIYLSHKKAGYLFIFFALLIGIARIMAGVHFPADILGGYILGIFVAYFVRYLWKHCHSK
jgi:membrane-associated phospholipid phosphatase